MMHERRTSNLLEEKINSTIDKKPHLDKDCLQVANHLYTIARDIKLDGSTERKLQKKLEQNEMKLSKRYLFEFEKINSIVQKFDEIAQKMNKSFLALNDKIGDVRSKNSDLLLKSNSLQQRKRIIELRTEEFNEFLENNSLSEEGMNEITKCEEMGRLSEELFKVLERANQIQENCKKVFQNSGHIAAFETIEYMQKITERGKRIICDNVKREFSNLSLEAIKKKLIVSKAVTFLQDDDAMLHLVIELYVPVRSNDLLEQFMKCSDSKMDNSSKDTLRSVSDTIATIHEIIVNEKELVGELFSLCEKSILEYATSKILDELLVFFSTPFKVKINQLVDSEKDPRILCEIVKILKVYILQIDKLIYDDCDFSKTLNIISESVKKLCMAEVNHTVGTILKKIWLQKDIFPSKEVHSCLGLFEDILKNMNVEHEEETVLFIDLKHLFELIIEPLVQAVQINSSLLTSDIDVAIFTINCLTTIRLQIPVRCELTEKIEKIDAMIESNCDVLVSEQTSEMLRKSGILPVYMAIRNSEIEKSDTITSTLPGLETNSIVEALIKLFSFLQSNFDPTANIFGLIHADNRQLIRKRCILEFINIYELIIEVIENPLNGYDMNGIHYLPTSQVLQLLNFENNNN